MIIDVKCQHVVVLQGDLSRAKSWAIQKNLKGNKTEVEVIAMAVSPKIYLPDKKRFKRNAIVRDCNGDDYFMIEKIFFEDHKSEKDFPKVRYNKMCNNRHVILS